MPEPIYWVDVSLDYDFFIRECFSWDFGHSDARPLLYKCLLWGIRYQSIDLYTETDIATYADFAPCEIFAQLRAKGLPPPCPKTPVSVCDNHQYALPFFTDRAFPAPRTFPARPDLVLNLDAHHDCYSLPSEEARDFAEIAFYADKIAGKNMPDEVFPKASYGLHCGNWLALLSDQWAKLGVAFQQVYPKWKAPEKDGAPAIEIPRTQWADWAGLHNKNARIRRFFLCRSPEWVPPHHDKAFEKLALHVLCRSAHPYTYDALPGRNAPTQHDAQRAYRLMQAFKADWFEKVRPVNALHPGERAVRETAYLAEFAALCRQIEPLAAGATNPTGRDLLGRRLDA